MNKTTKQLTSSAMYSFFVTMSAALLAIWFTNFTPNPKEREVNVTISLCAAGLMAGATTILGLMAIASSPNDENSQIDNSDC